MAYGPAFNAYLNQINARTQMEMNQYIQQRAIHDTIVKQGLNVLQQASQQMEQQKQAEQVKYALENQYKYYAQDTGNYDPNQYEPQQTQREMKLSATKADLTKQNNQIQQQLDILQPTGQDVPPDRNVYQRINDLRARLNQTQQGINQTDTVLQTYKNSPDYVAEKQNEGLNKFVQDNPINSPTYFKTINEFQRNQSSAFLQQKQRNTGGYGGGVKDFGIETVSKDMDNMLDKISQDYSIKNTTIPEDAKQLVIDYKNKLPYAQSANQVDLIRNELSIKLKQLKDHTPQKPTPVKKGLFGMTPKPQLTEEEKQKQVQAIIDKLKATQGQ